VTGRAVEPDAASRPPRPRLPVAVAVFAGVAGALSLVVFTRLGLVRGGLYGSWVDVSVYREAVLAWVAGRPLYDLGYTANALPFTYPPFAVLVLGWLALPDEQTAARLMTLVNVAALLAICRVSVGTALRGPGRVWPVRSAGAVWAVTIAVAGVAGWLEPVRLTVGYGQVNLLLGLAVLLDALVVPPRWRGVLTGLAASVKLVPAIFALYFLVTRQYRAVVRMAAAAAGATLLAGVVLPSSSWRFWTSTVWARTPGKAWFTANQSIDGVVERLLRDGPAVGPVTAVLTLVVVAVGASAVAGCWRAGWRLTAVCACGLVGLLVSPISWSHHWIWSVPLVLGLALEVRSRAARACAWALLTAVAIGAHWYLPQWDDRELAWSWWMDVVGNLYGYLGLVILFVLAGTGVRSRRGSAPMPRDVPALRGSDLPTARL